MGTTFSSSTTPTLTKDLYSLHDLKNTMSVFQPLKDKHQNNIIKSNNAPTLKLIDPDTFYTALKTMYPLIVQVLTEHKKLFPQQSFVLAGGALRNVLTNTFDPYSDMDLFMCGWDEKLSVKQKWKSINALADLWVLHSGANPNSFMIERTSEFVNVQVNPEFEKLCPTNQLNVPKLQIILKHFSSVSRLLHAFDLGACQLAVTSNDTPQPTQSDTLVMDIKNNSTLNDQLTCVMTKAAMFSYSTFITTVHQRSDRFVNNLISRMIKYLGLGFSIVWNAELEALVPKSKFLQELGGDIASQPVTTLTNSYIAMLNERPTKDTKEDTKNTKPLTILTNSYIAMLNERPTKDTKEKISKPVTTFLEKRNEYMLESCRIVKLLVDQKYNSEIRPFLVALQFGYRFVDQKLEQLLSTQQKATMGINMLIAPTELDQFHQTNLFHKGLNVPLFGTMQHLFLQYNCRQGNYNIDKLTLILRDETHAESIMKYVQQLETYNTQKKTSFVYNWDVVVRHLRQLYLPHSKLKSSWSTTNEQSTSTTTNEQSASVFQTSLSDTTNVGTTRITNPLMLDIQAV